MEYLLGEGHFHSLRQPLGVWKHRLVPQPVPLEIGQESIQVFGGNNRSDFAEK